MATTRQQSGEPDHRGRARVRRCLGARRRAYDRQRHDQQRENRRPDQREAVPGGGARRTVVLVLERSRGQGAEQRPRPPGSADSRHRRTRPVTPDRRATARAPRGRRPISRGSPNSATACRTAVWWSAPRLAVALDRVAPARPRVSVSRFAALRRQPGHGRRHPAEQPVEFRVGRPDRPVATRSGDHRRPTPGIRPIVAGEPQPLGPLRTAGPVDPAAVRAVGPASPRPPTVDHWPCSQPASSSRRSAG